MTRITIILAFLLGGLLSLAAPAGAAEEPAATPPQPVRFVTLTPNVVVQGDVVLLGDVFDGVDKYAERVVAYAPRPGARAVYDARWLARVAQAFKLNWRPASRADRVVVERASQIVTRTDVERVINDYLAAQGGDADARAQLSNKAFRLHLPLDEDATMTIEQLSHNPSTGHFTAYVAWGSGAKERLRLTGKIEHMTDVPVLAERVRRGDVISEHDLKWVRLAESQLPRNTVVDADRLVGMAAKRALQPEKPVVTSDLRRPLLVNRGETVTMQLTTPAMQLSAKGRALQSGSQGDTIRISNLQTNTVVDAVVTGPGQARVETFVNLAMR